MSVGVSVFVCLFWVCVCIFYETGTHMMRCLYERRAPRIAISHTVLPDPAKKYSKILPRKSFERNINFFRHFLFFNPVTVYHEKEAIL